MDNQDGTATRGFTPSPPGTFTINFTASNTNVNTVFHPKPYTATQTLNLVLLP